MFYHIFSDLTCCNPSNDFSVFTSLTLILWCGTFGTGFIILNAWSCYDDYLGILTFLTIVFENPVGGADIFYGWYMRSCSCDVFSITFPKHNVTLRCRITYEVG